MKKRINEKLTKTKTPIIPTTDESDPVEAVKSLRAEVAKFEGGYRKKLHACLIKAYAAALKLSSNRRHWGNFIADGVWDKQPQTDRPVEKDRKKALRFVLEYAFDAQTPEGYNRVMKYHRAFEASFRKKLSADQVRRKLKRAGGIDPMYDLARQHDPKHKKAVPSANSDIGDAADSGSGRTSAKSAEGLGRKTRRGRIDLDSTLYVEVDANQLHLGLDVPIGGKVAILAERLPSPDGWVRLKAKRVRVLPQKDDPSDDEWEDEGDTEN